MMEHPSKDDKATVYEEQGARPKQALRYQLLKKTHNNNVSVELPFPQMENEKRKSIKRKRQRGENMETNGDHCENINGKTNVSRLHVHRGSRRSIDTRSRCSVDRERRQGVNRRTRYSVDRERGQDVDSRSRHSVDREGSHCVDSGSRHSEAGRGHGVERGGRSSVDKGSRHSVNAGNRNSVDGGSRHSVDAGGRHDVDRGGRNSVNSGSRNSVDAGGRQDADRGGRNSIDSGNRHGVDAGGSHDADRGGRISVDSGSGHSIYAGGRQDADRGGRNSVGSGSRHSVDAGGRHGVDRGGRNSVDGGSRHSVDAGGRHDVDRGGRNSVNSGSRNSVDAGGRQDADRGGRNSIDSGNRHGVDAGGSHDADRGGRISVDSGSGHSIYAGGRQDADRGGRNSVGSGSRHSVDAGGRHGVARGGRNSVDSGSRCSVDAGGSLGADRGGRNSVDSGTRHSVGAGGRNVADRGSRHRVDIDRRHCVVSIGRRSEDTEGTCGVERRGRNGKDGGSRGRRQMLVKDGRLQRRSTSYHSSSSSDSRGSSLHRHICYKKEKKLQKRKKMDSTSSLQSFEKRAGGLFKTNFVQILEHNAQADRSIKGLKVCETGTQNSWTKKDVGFDKKLNCYNSFSKPKKENSYLGSFVRKHKEPYERSAQDRNNNSQDKCLTARTATRFEYSSAASVEKRGGNLDWKNDAGKQKESLQQHYVKGKEKVPDSNREKSTEQTALRIKGNIKVKQCRRNKSPTSDDEEVSKGSRFFVTVSNKVSKKSVMVDYVKKRTGNLDLENVEWIADGDHSSQSPILELTFKSKEDACLAEKNIKAGNKKHETQLSVFWNETDVLPDGHCLNSQKDNFRKLIKEVGDLAEKVLQYHRNIMRSVALKCQALEDALHKEEDKQTNSAARKKNPKWSRARMTNLYRLENEKESFETRRAAREKEMSTLENKYEELCKQEREFSTSLRRIKNKLIESRTLRLYSRISKQLEQEFKIECNRLKQALPIYARRSDIVQLVRNHHCCIVLGETGSGKSTQMTQYLYQAGFANNGVIVCTQPRKIAAVSLATHVASELGTSIGDVVGYKVGMKEKCCKNTKILYMTDHMLMQECLKDKTMTKFSCIIINEAHERSLHTDLLLGMVQSCLKSRPELKVIVTSATIRSEIFQNFFGGCPALQVSGRLFPVEIRYCPPESDDDLFEIYESFALEKAVEVHQTQGKGDVLVFLTSPLETERCCQRFMDKVPNQSSYQCFPLHGKLQREEQDLVFKPISERKRKIIFATNCAETSITIPGVRYVIDSGMVKEMQYDQRKTMNCLTLKMTNQSSAEQRTGRAGRTLPGMCYRMYSEGDFQSMNPTLVPEILRVHLGNAVLKLMELDVDPLEFQFVESPERSSMTTAMDTLVDVGAVEGKRLTQLGRWLAKIPLDPRLSLLIKKSVDCDLAFEGILVAALSATGNNLFFRVGNLERKNMSDLQKTKFVSEAGDLLTMLNVYREWDKQSESKKGSWCFENSINGKVIRGVRETANEITDILRREMSIICKHEYHPEKTVESKMLEIIFESFRLNLCFYLGQPFAGYLCLKTGQRIYLQPSSSQLTLHQLPKWIVFDQITHTTKEYITNATVVTEDLVPDKMYLKGELVTQKKLDYLAVKPIFTLSAGSQVFRAIVGPCFSNLKCIEAKLTEKVQAMSLKVNQEYCNSLDKGDLSGGDPADIETGYKMRKEWKSDSSRMKGPTIATVKVGFEGSDRIYGVGQKSFVQHFGSKSQIEDTNCRQKEDGLNGAEGGREEESDLKRVRSEVIYASDIDDSDICDSIQGEFDVSLSGEESDWKVDRSFEADLDEALKGIETSLKDMDCTDGGNNLKFSMELVDQNNNSKDSIAEPYLGLGLNSVLQLESETEMLSDSRRNGGGSAVDGIAVSCFEVGVGSVGTVGRRNQHGQFVGNHQTVQILKRPKQNCGANIKVNLESTVTVGGCLEIDLVQDQHAVALVDEEKLGLDDPVVLIEADRDKGLIQVYASHNQEPAFVDEIFDGLVIDVAMDLVLEQCTVFVDDSSNLRVILGEGGCVKQILLPSEYLEVVVFSQEPIITRAQVQEKFSEYGRIERITMAGRKTRDGRYVVCEVKFDGIQSARRAVEATREDKTMIAKPGNKSSGRKIGNVRKGILKETTANFLWVRRPHMGYAYIQFRERHHIKKVLAHRMFHIKNCLISISPSKRADISREVYLLFGRNGDELTVEDLEDSLLDIVVDDEEKDAMDFDEPPIFTIELPRKDASVGEEKIEQLEKDLSLHVSRCFHLTGRLNLSIFTPEEEDVFFDATAEIDPKDAGKIKPGLMHKLFNGEHRIKVELVKTYDLPVRKDVYEMCKPAIDAKLKHQSECEYSIRVEDDEVVIRLESEEMCNAIGEITGGEYLEPIEGINLHQFLSTSGRAKLQTIGQETSTCLFVDARTMRLVVNGIPDNRKKALKEVIMLVKNSSEGISKEFSLGGENCPPGLMKALLIKVGHDLHGIFDIQGVSSANLEFRKQILKVTGSEHGLESVTSLVGSLETCHDAEHGDKSAATSAVEIICVVCLSDINTSDLYRLEYCGHSYCSFCFKEQITQAVMSTQLPLVCAECESPWVCKDLFSATLLGHCTLENLAKAALRDYIQQRHSEYRYCITADCGMIYKVTNYKRRYKCHSCGEVICTNCHTKFHGSVSCEKTRSELAENDFMAWMSEDPENRKFCPNCSVGIEKNSGCDHIKCRSCKSNICWLCLELFRSTRTCYEHLSTVHGGIGLLDAAGVDVGAAGLGQVIDHLGDDFIDSDDSLGDDGIDDFFLRLEMLQGINAQNLHAVIDDLEGMLDTDSSDY